MKKFNFLRSPSLILGDLDFELNLAKCVFLKSILSGRMVGKAKDGERKSPP